MPDDLGHVRRGQPIAVSARTWNAFIDAARAHQAGGGAGRPAPGRGAGGGAFVQVLNDSGSARARHDVLGISGPLFDPDDTSEEAFAANRGFIGGPPSAGGPFGILIEPVASGVVGKAVVCGVVQCTINVQDATDEYADCSNAEYGNLVSCPVGPVRILWRQSPEESGTMLAVVLLSQCMPVGTGSYKVLQINEDGVPVWDWVRGHE